MNKQYVENLLEKHTRLAGEQSAVGGDCGAFHNNDMQKGVSVTNHFF